MKTDWKTGDGGWRPSAHAAKFKARPVGGTRVVFITPLKAPVLENGTLGLVFFNIVSFDDMTRVV